MYLKNGVVNALAFVGIASAANAEFLLFKKTADQKLEIIDKDSFNKTPKNEQEEILNIFNSILLKYQWPMVSTYFYTLSSEEKTEFLKYLKEQKGIQTFIQTKIDKSYGANRYKIYFVPATLFEISAINSFMDELINSNAKISQGSIFPSDDLRNGAFGQQKFADLYADVVHQALTETAQREHADLLSLNKAAEIFNSNPSVLDMFLSASSYLKK